MNRNGKRMMGILMMLVFVYFAWRMIRKFVDGTPFELGDLASVALLIVALLQFLTWGFDKKAQKDEMGQKITHLSLSVSYWVMTFALFFLWIADRILFVRRNEFGNETLFFALCLSLVLYPAVQFFVARRFR